VALAGDGEGRIVRIADRPRRTPMTIITAVLTVIVPTTVVLAVVVDLVVVLAAVRRWAGSTWWSASWR
jgi:hypothetical protein